MAEAKPMDESTAWLALDHAEGYKTTFRAVPKKIHSRQPLDGYPVSHQQVPSP